MIDHLKAKLLGCWLVGAILLAGLPLGTEAADPRPLASYPRPAVDTGLGLHWFPMSGGWSAAQVDFYVGEMKLMGISWVKLMTGAGPQEEVDYLVAKLTAAGIMPIIRLAGRSGENDGDMSGFVRHYVALGAQYFEFFNEPAVDEPGIPLSMVMDRWMARAQETQRAGGIPLLTSLFPSNDPQDARSYDAALRYLKEKGAAAIFRQGAGVAVHNYALNHPLDYPDDAVHQRGEPLSVQEALRFGIDEGRRQEINRRRAADKKPGTTIDQDPWGFRMFETMENRFVQTFGFAVPVLGTEGGATVGEVDARYPRVDEARQAELTVDIAAFMRHKAPDYYFATCNWLIGNAVMGRPTFPAWEDQAWYRPDRQMPVVESLKKWFATSGGPRVTGSGASEPSPTAPPSAPARELPPAPEATPGNDPWPRPAPGGQPWIVATVDEGGVITLTNEGSGAAWVFWGDRYAFLPPGGRATIEMASPTGTEASPLASPGEW